MEDSLIIFYVTIVLVYCCLLYNIPDKDYLHMVILTLLTMLLIYIGQQYIISSGKVRNNNSSSSKQYNKKLNKNSVEHFDTGLAYLNPEITSESPENVNSMGPYDGKCLSTTSPPNKYAWMKPPVNSPLLKSTGFVAQGSQGPLTDRISETKYQDGPYLDGTSDTSKGMFMFSKNKCNPGCCPSTFSCDGGCICTTEKQREFINRRGVMSKTAIRGLGSV